MSSEVWAIYFVAYALICVTPGPAVLFITSQSAWRGPAAGVMAALGIETANTIFWALSALGLAAAIAASQALFMIIKWAGAAYLAWLGVAAIAGTFKREVAAAPQIRAARHAFRDGLVVGLSNPKAMLFFVALLPQFIDPTRVVFSQTLLLAVTSLMISFAVNAGYAFAAGALRRVFSRGSVKRWFDRCIGGIFLWLAAAAAFYRRAA
jgi:homoserine/homoserine lactone efflux protein